MPRRAGDHKPTQHGQDAKPSVCRGHIEVAPSRWTILQRRRFRPAGHAAKLCLTYYVVIVDPTGLLTTKGAIVYAGRIGEETWICAAKPETWFFSDELGGTVLK